MLTVKDTSKLLADLPRGAWVALSHDEERVVSYGFDLQEVMKKATERGESQPIVTRVPESNPSTLLV
jgi:Family of unknown function (DUF5678)